ncbi:hypothetical protein HYT25_03520 [Candidatus Pacearchaeota archaeon]|nr:hypothetical protein [Candidatus Pacearchaeota archaeon]
MKNKKGVEFQFAWLFGLVVGMIILVLAIYAVSRVIQTEELSIDAATAKEIGVLLNPLETGFESAKTTTLVLPKETRIFNGCNNESVFGRQTLRISQRSFNKWTDTNINVGFSNKYIFSENFTEGKKFFIFSKPFEFPFKISDVIYITSSNKKYCFENAPEDISEELSNLGQENIFTDDCPDESIEVCFSGNCEIKVDLFSGYVEKNSERMHFPSDSMMYAAIFSSPEIYECQVERLMMRGTQLSILYSEKSDIVASRGCNSDLKNELVILSDRLNQTTGSAGLNTALINDIEDIKEKNENANCKLW